LLKMALSTINQSIIHAGSLSHSRCFIFHVVGISCYVLSFLFSMSSGVLFVYFSLYIVFVTLL